MELIWPHWAPMWPNIKIKIISNTVVNCTIWTLIYVKNETWLNYSGTKLILANLPIHLNVGFLQMCWCSPSLLNLLVFFFGFLQVFFAGGNPVGGTVGQ